MPLYKGLQKIAGRGKSAYEAAVEGGFTGTEQEFNDLLANLGVIDLSGKYEKPSAGIPLTDLAAAVQALLVLADTALQAADLSGHNTSGTAHNDLRLLIDAAKAIAEGRSRGRKFDTKADLDAWLLNPANVSELQIGDNFYIVDTGVPDFWWTGTGIEPLEVDKVFLLDYYTKTQADNRYLQAITKALVEAVLTGDVSSHTHGAYSPASHSHALLDFFGADTLKTSLASMDITKRITHVAAGTAQSFSMASVAMEDVDYCIVFRASAATSVAIPPTSPAYETTAKASYSLDAGAVLLIHVFRSSYDGKYYVNAEEKQ